MREEAIANSWSDEQKPNTKAYQAYKLAKGSEAPKGNCNLDAQIRQVNDEKSMSHPCGLGKSSRVVTTNVEEVAEVEVAVFEQNRAKNRIIRNDNHECMFRYFLLLRGNGQNINAINYIDYACEQR